MPEASPTAPSLTPDRPWPQRVLIWLLRRWWALAVLVIGGALTSQFGQVAQTIFTAILRGEAPSFEAVGTSWTQTIATLNVPRAIIIFSIALILTIAAYLAERVEVQRERQSAAVAEAQRAATAQDATANLIKDILKTHRNTLIEGDDEEGEPDAAARYIALPPRPALVVGREADLARIAAALSAPGATVVALRGMGGVGKTTLLAETLHCQAEAQSYPDGVVWLSAQDLVDQDGAAQLYEALGSAMGRSEVARASGLAAKAAALRKALTGKRLLIGLDNVEQLLPLSQISTNLTPHNGDGVGPVIVLTTRASFVNDLSGLREINLDELDPEAGLVLLTTLLDRAGKPLAAEDAAVARSIVIAVGALPLAIELVAPRIARRAEPIAALAARLRNDGGVQLRGTTRGIERSFSDTYQQLDPDQQIAFSALAVFAGASFSQDVALIAIRAAQGREDPDPQVLLDLCDLSLLREMPQTEGPPRYQLHPLLKQYARERLRERDTAIAYRISLAVARAYRTFAQRAAGRRGGYNQGTLEQEYPNLAGAIIWAHDQMIADPQGDRGQEGTQLVGDFCGALRFFMNDHGYWTDARRFLDWGIAADRRLGNHRREATLLVTLGFIQRQQGDLDAAERSYTASLNIARARGDKQAEGARIQNLGTVELLRQHYDRARSLYEQSLALRRDAGDKGGLSSVLRALGILAAEEGRLSEARQYLREALDLFQGRSRDVAFARTLRELAAVYIRDPEGDHERARQILEEAMQTLRARNQRYDIAQSLDWLGTLDVLESKTAEAHKHWGEALEIYQWLGSNMASQVRDRLARLDAVQKAPVPSLTH